MGFLAHFYLDLGLAWCSPSPWRRKAESTASAEATASATAEMREAMVSSDGKKIAIENGH